MSKIILPAKKLDSALRFQRKKDMAIFATKTLVCNVIKDAMVHRGNFSW